MGKFQARINPDKTISYTLQYSQLAETGAVIFADIHFGQKCNVGGIIVFLCVPMCRREPGIPYRLVPNVSFWDGSGCYDSRDNRAAEHRWAGGTRHWRDGLHGGVGGPSYWPRLCASPYRLVHWRRDSRLDRRRGRKRGQKIIRFSRIFGKTSASSQGQ